MSNRISKAVKRFFGVGEGMPTGGDSQSILSFLLGNRGSSDKEIITEEDSVGIIAVYACVRLISFEMAANPIYYMRYENNSKYRNYDSALFNLLRYEPNPEMSATDFKRAMQFQLEIWGNAYAEVQRNVVGEPVALWIIPSYRVEKMRDNKTWELYYTVSTDNGIVKLKEKDIIHLRGLGDGLVGMRPIRLARRALELAVSAEKYGVSFFSNGANASGICTYPEAMNEEAYQRFKETFSEAYTGLSNQQRVMFLEEGMTFQQLTIPNDNAQFIETRTYQALEVCRLFGVPPHKIGILDRATFSNIEHQGMDFDQQCILPRTIQWEEELRRVLLTDEQKAKGDFFKINLDNRFRVSMETKTTYYREMRQNGVLSTDDIRELEDMNAIGDEKGGNVYLVNGNMIPLNVAKLNNNNINIRKAQKGDKKDDESRGTGNS